MNFDANSFRLIRAIAIAVAVIVVMSVAAEVIKPLALAILLAFILTPLVEWFENRGLPRAASVILVLVLVVAALGGLGYVVGGQFASLADQLPTYHANVQEKLATLKPVDNSALEKITRVLSNLEKSLRPAEADYATPVRVVSDNATIAQLQSWLGPFHVTLAFGGVVLLLLVFLLFESNDISDRILQMVGWGNIGITTKTMTQIGHGLSRYLATLALFNAAFGVAIGLGLWAIGVPYPVLWGLLAGILRFVPYLGTLVSFSFPAVIAVAHSPLPGWTQLLLVVALYGGAELVANSIEPLVYGKTTGISPVGLLVAALFWTWLWGGLGLLLANPLTVCLAVVGQSIPSLAFLGTLLSHEVEVADDLRWYQRVLHRDQEGAIALLEEAMKTRPLENVCDQIVIPTLARAEQDRDHGFLDKRDVSFIWRVVRDWLNDLADRDDLVLTARVPEVVEHTEPARARVPVETTRQTLVGIATNGGVDALVLRMLNLLLEPSGVRLTIISASGSPMHISDKVDDLNTGLIVISHLPPLGLTRTRYLIKRLRARHAQVPMLVGFWDAKADAAQVAEQLRSASAYHVALSVAAARTMILDRVAPKVPTAASPLLEPAQDLHEETASSNPVVARVNR
jgi:predicted PurR-regulated permease PerM